MSRQGEAAHRKLEYVFQPCTRQSIVGKTKGFVLLSEETHTPSSRHHRRPNLLLSFDLSDYIPTGTESTYQHQRLEFLQPLRSRVRELTFFPLVLSNPNTPTQKPQIPRHPKPPPTNPLNPAPTVELFQSRNAKREKRDDMVSRIERRREVVG